MCAGKICTKSFEPSLQVLGVFQVICRLNAVMEAVWFRRLVDVKRRLLRLKDKLSPLQASKNRIE